MTLLVLFSGSSGHVYNDTMSGGALGGGTPVVTAAYAPPLTSAGLFGGGAAITGMAFNPPLVSAGAWANGTGPTLAAYGIAVVSSGVRGGGQAQVQIQAGDFILSAGALGGGSAVAAAQYSITPASGLAAASSGVTQATYQPPVTAAGAALDGSVPENPPFKPKAPTGLTATQISDTEVFLDWVRADDSETYVVVERSPDGATFTAVSTLGPGENCWFDPSLWPNTTYYYRVKAGNTIGASGYSNTAGTTTQTTAAHRTDCNAQPIANVSDLAATAVDAWTVMVSCTDPALSTSGLGANTTSYILCRSDDGGLTYRAVQQFLNGSTGTVTATDRNLQPGTTYRYRVVLGSVSGYLSGPSNEATVTLPTRPVGVPPEPTAFSATVNSATSVTLNWTDNSGGTATYKVEQGIDPFNPWTFTQVGVTSAGATIYPVATTAETYYRFRIRAHNANGDSDYSPALVVRTCSAGTGNPSLYEVGPGKPYASVGAINWAFVGPGDTVRIYPNKDGSNNIIPYNEIFFAGVRGLPSARITIEGIAENGQRPIFDGTNATTNTQFQTGVYDGFGGLIVVNRNLNTGLYGTTSAQGWAPGYLTIQGLEFRGYYRGDSGGLTFTNSGGTVKAYDYAAAGIYLGAGEDILIEDCYVHGNGNGIFGAGGSNSSDTGQDQAQKPLKTVTVRNCLVHLNGNPGHPFEHEIYMEADDVTYEYNHLGPAYGGGNALKDRGTNTVVRYNLFEGSGPSAHIMDLVEAENHRGLAVTLPTFHKVYVYGNLIYNPTTKSGGTGSASPIHVGGDRGLYPCYRRGPYYFHFNTYVLRRDQTDPNSFTSTIFIGVDNAYSAKTKPVVDARNNLIYNLPDTTGTVSPLVLHTDKSFAYWGNGWIRTGWSAGISTGGRVAGTSSFAQGTDPLLVDVTDEDFHLTAGSPCVGITPSKLSGGVSVAEEYLDPLSSAVRSDTNDFGALSFQTATYDEVGSGGIWASDSAVVIGAYSSVASGGAVGSGTAIVSVNNHFIYDEQGSGGALGGTAASDSLVTGVTASGGAWAAGTASADNEIGIVPAGVLGAGAGNVVGALNPSSSGGASAGSSAEVGYVRVTQLRPPPANSGCIGLVCATKDGSRCVTWKKVKQAYVAASVVCSQPQTRYWKE